ncbi:lariat debranching enzyme, C-terminal domain-containing protein [Bisporella sp. PMI_857]|nr:lariat debranching enzyme, C-terminal domain-containing protein [Bisporella sp. PMI_857]
MDSITSTSSGLRVAVEGCGHGTLDAIYASVKTASEARRWDQVDLLIIGGDFQAVRNASDLTIMSCPVKYRAIGDFHYYYSGMKKAPYLTIFVGGNHEASSHLWELYYGGWVAPNIYYMGAANVVRVGGVRIAGISGIWKGYNYNKHHYERLPYSADDIKSIYHVREIDTRKLLQLRTQVDIGISHDWPRAIEKNGNQKALFRVKPDFEQESRDGTLGSVAAEHVMDRLRPPYWFAAHMHCKFSATKIYDEELKPEDLNAAASLATNNPKTDFQETVVVHNDDEIDLEMNDDDDESPVVAETNDGTSPNSANVPKQATNIQETILETSAVPLEIRNLLPAAFSRPKPQQRMQPGQPPPSGIANKTVRFLALDKCLPGRKFLQLLEVQAHTSNLEKPLDESIARSKPKFEYDPEWLAITRVFAPYLVLGDRSAQPIENLGEERYRSLIDNERLWIDENIVKAGKLKIPENFELTAPPYQAGTPEIINEGPKEYDNPQTQQFCDLIGINNNFAATEEERAARFKNGPVPSENRGFNSRSNGRGRGRGGESGGHGRGGRRGRGR